MDETIDRRFMRFDYYRFDGVPLTYKIYCIQHIIHCSIIHIICT